ncbi:hypothetical protein B0J13DRAFT_621318 [Dactylonectria estremocensis]|uniref:Ricin B lectin domain-containing protein n=1 Tax=Dactylonectria estremocensis TaxID=1079267 RepID=A0A9P9F0A5_9HYPO|nr:hypothetical protein B0J13DRAFT_621318 [Dactylonectria estremocensis]
MFPFKCLVLFCSLATAAVLPRAVKDVPAGACCFTLHDTSTGAIVQQNKDSGFLYLNGAQPNGWYCINLSNSQNILLDDFNNACFLAPDGLLQCLDPTIGPNSWTLKKSGSNTLLAHDGSTTFTSCPGKPSGRLLYGTKSGDSSQCKKITLKAKDFTGTCKSFSARSLEE